MSQLKTVNQAEEITNTTRQAKLFIPHSSSLIPLFYLAVAIAFTWPLALNLSNRVILAESGDVWQHLWNNWWMRFSLLELHTHPYYTPLLFHPTGANLYFHALHPLDGYISTPLQLLFGLVASFNLVILLQLTVAGYGTYLLAYHLTTFRPAALVAGVIYACSPLESRLLNLGQLELTSIQWLPLYLLCFIKTLEGAKRPWLWRGLSVLLLLALSLTTWYYLLYAVLFSGLYTLYRLWQERLEWRQTWPRTLALAVGVLVVYVVLISPILLPTLREASSGGTQQRIFNVIYNSATVKGLFTTGPSLLWGVFGSADNPEYRGNFLGYVALVLAGLGLITNLKKGWIWGIVASVFLVLALGPVLHFGFDPNWTPETADSGLNLPGRLLYNLPFGNIARVPLRYALVTILALAVLAAYGLSWLAKRLEGWGRHWAALSLPMLAGLLVFLEFMPGPRRLADTAIPAFYNQLRDEGRWNDFAILETPDQGNASIISRAMYFQTAHGHPIVGGYLSRKPNYEFKEFPGITQLLNLDFRGLLQRDILERASLSNTIGVLQYYKIRYVILHPQLLQNEDSRFNAREVLQTIFGPTATPHYQDAQLQVWQVPAASEPNRPDAAKILPQLSEGWGARRDGPGGAERSIGQQARLALFNPFGQALTVEVRVGVRSAREASKLTLVLNGKEINEQTVGPTARPLTLTVELKPGLNDLSFKTDGSITFNQFYFANA